MYQENFDQEVNKQQFPSFAELFLRTILEKRNRGHFAIDHKGS